MLYGIKPSPRCPYWTSGSLGSLSRCRIHSLPDDDVTPTLADLGAVVLADGLGGPPYQEVLLPSVG